MLNRIDKTLNLINAEKKFALAPFITIGYPDIDTSVQMSLAALNAGGDMLELGVPFSDPLADGKTIQMTSSQALQNGVTIKTCLKTVERLRKEIGEAPLILMGYMNPFLKYGLNKFVADAVSVGVDGLIIPDLPTEEASEFNALCHTQNLHLIPLLAPTSTDSRIRLACKGASGFIYCVSLTGVTGARNEVSSGLEDLIKRIRHYSDLPVLVGFGISTKAHVSKISKFANGAVFASAMLDQVSKEPKENAVEVVSGFVNNLRSGIKS